MRPHRPFAIAACIALGLTGSAWAADDKPIRALLVCGGCCHDYAAQKGILTKGISARANVTWTIMHDPDSGTKHPNPVYQDATWAQGYDIVVHDECSADVISKDFVDSILAPHRKGLPAVNLHCAMHCYRVPGSDDWFTFTGLTTHSHGAQLPIALSFVGKDHAILAGLAPWTTINEEQYHNEKVWDTVTPLIRGKQGNDDDVVAWVNDFHGTKVFSTTLGHNNATVGDPRYLDLVTRGLLWTLGKLDDQHFHAPVQHENLAKGRAATASSQQGDEHAPALANDGDGGTRWCASGPDVPQWWQVDLGSAQDLTGVQIAWERGIGTHYTISGSADGQTWKQLVDASAGGDGDHAFSASGVRHVRIDVKSVENNGWASIFEVQVLGTKAAR